jgi:hypothetical protein
VTSPPQVITRALTFNFSPSINASTGLPDILDISVIPLSSASSNGAGATFAGGVRSNQIELSQPINSWTVNLIPSNLAGLTDPINYRVLYRTGVLGPATTLDFSMLDQDIDFETLISDTANIISGEVYLQQSDLGVPGRVARLDSSGNVLDSEGTICATEADITAVDNLITAETNARSVAVNSLNTTLQTAISTQVASTLNTAEAYTTTQVGDTNSALAAERGVRQAADTDLQNQINTNAASIITNSTAISTLNTDLATKADLVGGTLSVTQIPTELLTSAIPVANQAAMLALSPTVAHKGDLAVRPDGVFLLNTDDPSQLVNWIALSVVSSVNGKRGAVVLAASDVGAVPVGGAIAQSQVTGLATALSAKANQTDLVTANAAITAIQNDTTLVHTTAGVIPSTLLDSNMVYLNSSGQLVHKDGTIIPLGSGGTGAVFSVNGQTGLVVLTASSVGAIATGASITQAQVTGLSTALANKADLSSGALNLSQVPTNIPQASISGLVAALAAKADLTGGFIPLSQVPTLPQAQITGLSTLISGNQLTGSTNAINRIAALESEIVSGGGGGGGGIGPQAEFWTSANTTTAVTASDFSTVVNLHSPWGIDSDGTITGTVGTWYYLYTGVRSTDAAYPYISPNGHLNLRKWNEAGAADPMYALASDLAALTTTVGTKAAASDLATTNTTVATKANQSDLTALSTTVDAKANEADLTALTTTVGTKANQSDLDTTNATVATLATAASVTALSTTVGTKANQSDMTTAQNNITTINSTLTTKADLVSGVLKSTQIPTGIPQASVSGLTTALAGKADLSGGVLATGQIPTNIPQSSVTGLGTALGNKADLVSGLVPLSQIPPGALTNVVQVANQAAMLALTSATVQYGDFCEITGTSAAGTYILIGADPSLLANWMLVGGTGSGTITSVNGYTGPTVVLSASDVGALGASASIPQSQITGLSTALATFATTAFSDVQSMISSSSLTKRADYVATSAIASLAGLQSIDGVLVSNGSVVLATAQSSSVNNGLWIASTGSWTRATDYSTGSYLSKDTLVFVANQTGGANGTANNATIWQMQSASGFIDTATSSWTKIGYIALPFAPVQGNGITITGQTFAANVLAGGGILAPAGGIQRDPNVVPAKFLGTVPAGATVAGITHNLNTTSPIVSIWDTGSNTLVLAGITVTSANAISIEFASAPTTGQYRVCCIG